MVLASSCGVYVTLFGVMESPERSAKLYGFCGIGARTESRGNALSSSTAATAPTPPESCGWAPSGSRAPIVISASATSRAIPTTFGRSSRHFRSIRRTTCSLISGPARAASCCWPRSSRSGAWWASSSRRSSTRSPSETSLFRAAPAAAATTSARLPPTRLTTSFRRSRSFSIFTTRSPPRSCGATWSAIGAPWRANRGLSTSFSPARGSSLRSWRRPGLSASDPEVTARAGASSPSPVRRAHAPDRSPSPDRRASTRRARHRAHQEELERFPAVVVDLGIGETVEAWSASHRNQAPLGRAQRQLLGRRPEGRDVMWAV